jgi:hypothetical protein
MLKNAKVKFQSSKIKSQNQDVNKNLIFGKKNDK